MFATRQDYWDGLSVFLFIAGLIYLARHPEEPYPLYPGFKLVEGNSSAIHAFVARLGASDEMVSALAGMANEPPVVFRENWPKRAKRLNEASLGGRYHFFAERPIPDKIGD